MLFLSSEIRLVRTHPADPAPTMMWEKPPEELIELVEKCRVDEIGFDEKFRRLLTELFWRRIEPMAILEIPRLVTWYTVLWSPETNNHK